MIYDANKQIDAINARMKFDKLIEDKQTFTLSVKRKKRSYAQNRYLHLLLQYFANNYGETLEYVKQYFLKK